MVNAFIVFSQKFPIVRAQGMLRCNYLGVCTSNCVYPNKNNSLSHFIPQYCIAVNVWEPMLFALLIGRPFNSSQWLNFDFVRLLFGWSLPSGSAHSCAIEKVTWGLGQLIGRQRIHQADSLPNPSWQFENWDPHICDWYQTRRRKSHGMPWSDCRSERYNCETLATDRGFMRLSGRMLIQIK